MVSIVPCANSHSLVAVGQGKPHKPRGSGMTGSAVKKMSSKSHQTSSTDDSP